jgi:type IV pilus assembly protein PilW
MNPTHHSRRCPAPASRTQAGFTMIELMVAITISLMILAALVTLLVNVNRNNSELAKANSQIENGRFAIQLLQNDIMQAGFWGPFVPEFEDRSAAAVPTDVPSAIPDPCLAYTPLNWNTAYLANLVGIPVQSASSAPGSCAGVVSAKKDNTDVLVVRRAASCVPGEANCELLVADELYFQASMCPAEIDAGQPYAINTAGLDLQTGACNGTPAPLRKFVSHIYWIRDFAVTAGDGIPTLVRSQLDFVAALEHQPAEVLIEGIEGFNVELGIDNTVTRSGLNTPVNYAVIPDMVDPATGTAHAESKYNTLPKNRGDGIPDGAFIRCTATGAAPCTAADLMNTVAVKLYVLARSREATPGHVDDKTYQLGTVTLQPFNDGFKRHVFSTTVRMVNVSGRRETR